jgi:hypothetical protein
MRVIPVDKPPGPAGHLAKPRGFWQRLAQALDAYFVDRTRRAVPNATFRRSRHEIERCRRLMLEGALSPAYAKAVYGSSRRAVRMTQPL